MCTTRGMDSTTIYKPRYTTPHQSMWFSKYSYSEQNLITSPSVRLRAQNELTKRQHYCWELKSFVKKNFFRQANISTILIEDWTGKELWIKNGRGEGGGELGLRYRNDKRNMMYLSAQKLVRQILQKIIWRLFKSEDGQAHTCTSTYTQVHRSVL